MESDYIIKTFRGIELHYKPDITEQEIINWLQDNLDLFRLKRLREMFEEKDGMHWMSNELEGMKF